MDIFSLSTVLPALITLLGTLLVAFIGYRQWKRQYVLTRAGSAVTDKQVAYKSIWSKLEDAHLYVRSETFDKSNFLQLVRNVNIEMMQSSLFLASGEKKLVNEYLKALEILAKTLDRENDESLRQDVRDTLYATEEIPREVIQDAHALSDAYKKVEEKREILISRFRQAIGIDII